MKLSQTRRRFLYGSISTGISALAGCSGNIGHRSERNILKDVVQTQDSLIPRGVTVTSQHVTHWRKRYVDRAKALTELINRVKDSPPEGINDLTLAAPTIQNTLNTSSKYRDQWDSVTYLRTVTLSTETQIKTIKYHTGEYTVADLKKLTTKLARRLENAYSRLEYDRGGFDRGLVQLTQAEYVLDQAIRRKDVSDTVRNSNLTDRLVANAIRKIYEARARLQDVDYLIRALPQRTSHIPGLKTLHERLYPVAQKRIAELQLNDQYHGYSWHELTYGSSPSGLLNDELLLSVLRASKNDYYASAVMFSLRALVMAAGGAALNSRAKDVKNLDLAMVSKQAQKANQAFLTVIENADSLIALSLLRLLSHSLDEANERVRKELDPITISVSNLKKAFLRYVIVEASSQSIEPVTRRVDQP